MEIMPTDKLIEDLTDLLDEGKKPSDLIGQMTANLAKHWKDPSALNDEKAKRMHSVKPSPLIKASNKRAPKLNTDGSHKRKKR